MIYIRRGRNCVGLHIISKKWEKENRATKKKGEGIDREREDNWMMLNR